MKNRVTILGAGESGTGAALLAHSKGYEVFVSDAGAIKQKYKELLLGDNIPFEEKEHTDRIYDADLVIKSPGIPFTSEVVQNFRDLSIPVIDEIEFASRYTDAKIVAITGTNGKTTTTMLIHHLLTEGGINSVLAGNVGRSFAKAVLENEPDVYVVEVSSFQLEGIETFKPDVALLLNITPDHLDRYENSLELYAAAKLRMTLNMNNDDHFIYFDDDSVIRSFTSNVRDKVKGYGVSLHNPKAAAHYEDQQLVFHKPLKFKLSIEELALKGPHNHINCMCAVIAANIIGMKKKKIAQGLSSFKNAPHRLEALGEVKDVRFVNDSKATNVQSVKYALESFNVPLVLIAGGIDKGNDYSLILELVKRKVKALICLGKNNEKLKAAFQDDIEIIYETQDVCKATSLAYQQADPGDVVLLSPACSSFDLFKNYEDRGQQFKQCVEKLKEEFNSKIS